MIRFTYCAQDGALFLAETDGSVRRGVHLDSACLHDHSHYGCMKVGRVEDVFATLRRALCKIAYSAVSS